MVLQIFLESFFAKMAYWLYSFKKYFSVIAISQPKSGSDKTNTGKVTEDPTAKGDDCVKGDSRQYKISSSDNAVLGYVSTNLYL